MAIKLRMAAAWLLPLPAKFRTFSCWGMDEDFWMKHLDLNSEAGATVIALSQRQLPEVVRFDRRELGLILSVYGRHVASGEWRDYAIDFSRERAVFAILKRTGEAPLYRIEKDPKRAEKQGAYSIVAQGGKVLKRGAELDRVLEVLEKPVRVVG